VSPAVVLLLLLALKSSSAGNGPEAVARLRGQGIALLHTATNDRSQFSFPYDQWDVRDATGHVFVQYASADPSSYVVSRSFPDGRAAVIIEEGSGSLTASLRARALRLAA